MERKTALKRTSLYASGASPVNMAQAISTGRIAWSMTWRIRCRSPRRTPRGFGLQYGALSPSEDKYVVIRVNGLYSEFIEEDLEAAVRARPDAIRLPKVEYAREVERIDRRITEIEAAAGIETGSTEIWCNIESYLGVINAMEIAKASPRIAALALGAEDFTASMKAQRTKKGWEVFHARNMVLMAARAAGVDALDVVFSDINDLEGLREDTVLTKNLGFDGKTVIHPRQIDIVNSFFTPTQKEIEYASGAGGGGGGQSVSKKGGGYPRRQYDR